MRNREFTQLLGWPGYRVYQYEVEETAKRLKLWVRKKPVHRGFECSGCGRRVHTVIGTWEREVADLDCFEYRTTVVLDVNRLYWGMRAESGEDGAGSQQGAVYQEVRR